MLDFVVGRGRAGLLKKKKKKNPTHIFSPLLSWEEGNIWECVRALANFSSPGRMGRGEREAAYSVCREHRPMPRETHNPLP